MTKEKKLENQVTILTIALDRIWDHLTAEQQYNTEWIWKEMDDDLKKEKI